MTTHPEPTEAVVLRPEVLAFALLMERELRANDHKPGWKEDSPDALAKRVIEEADELYEVASTALAPVPKATRDRIASEAADVANMAMMVADVCGALSTRPQPAAGESGEPWYLQFSNTPPDVTIWAGLPEGRREVVYNRFDGPDQKTALAPVFQAIVRAHNAALPAPSRELREAAEALLVALDTTAPKPSPKPTIAELEAILASNTAGGSVEIKPNGSIHVVPRPEIEALRAALKGDPA